MQAGSAPFWIEENKQHEIPKFFSDRRRHHHGGGGWRGDPGEVEQDENGKYKPETYKLDQIRVRFMMPSTHHTMGGNAVTEIIVSGRTAAQAIEADNQ